MVKNKKDYLTFTIISQFVVCALLFGSVYGLKTVNSGVYSDLKSAYFNKIDTNFSIISENTDEKTEAEDVAIVEEIETESTTFVTETSQKETTEEDTTLSAEITGKGGKDYAVKDEDDIPSNVSVNNYSLNQQMVMPVNGRITSDFGIRNHPITGKLRFHAGIDIAASKGTPIYACFDGTVVTASYNQWNGNYLKIQHDNEIMTVYCHCEKLNVKKGDIVKAGDVIATIGSTGSSTGPHLHFEFRINDVSYDPEIAFKTAINGV